MKDKKRLLDILNAIEAIESYALSSYKAFIEDHKTQDAILYNLIIIGEAANQISETFQEKISSNLLGIHDRNKEYHYSWL